MTLLDEIHLSGRMKNNPSRVSVHSFPSARPAQRAEVLVTFNFDRLGLQSEDVENQSAVYYFGQRMQLHEALRSVIENCLSQWSQADYSSRDAFQREAFDVLERHLSEGEDLILEALRGPLQARAVARVGIMGTNFLRTLPKIYEALLRYPLQKSCTTKPTRVEVNIDWSVSGLTEWRTAVEFAFELAPKKQGYPDLRTQHVTTFYATDRMGHAQISRKQVANIFLLDESAVGDLETSALRKMREGYTRGADGETTLSEVAGG